MILRYRGCPYPPGSKRHYELPHLDVGREYEVAEIFEMEGHVMARTPGTERWPAPGEPTFGIHPEWFAPTSETIPIVSCGFRYDDFLVGLYGVLLHERHQIEMVKQLKTIDLPDDHETFDAWRSRELREWRRERAEALHALLTLPVPTHFGSMRHVFLCEERVSGDSFAYVGAFLNDLARRDVSRRVYGESLDRLLSVLEVRGSVVREIEASFWQGTRGGMRLINAPPDGRLVYGTDNPPDFLKSGTLDGDPSTARGDDHE